MSARKTGPQARRAATIKTIADETGLSLSTISRALRGAERVHPDTLKTVSEAAQRLGYRRDFGGTSLRTGKTFTLCAILASNPSLEFGDPATMHLIQGLTRGVEGTDFKLVILPVEGAEAQLAAVTESIETKRFDGVILDHTAPDDPRVRLLAENGVPFLTFGRTETSPPHAFLDIDNEDAAYMAAAYLLGQGHHRIALIDPIDGYMFTAQRLAGYRRALESAGIEVDEQLVVHIGISPGNVEANVEALCALPDPPTGFVTANEVATLSAIAGCRKAGADMTRLHFVSRDGTKFFDFYETAVSSCYYSVLDIGCQLSRMLVDLVRGRPAGELQRLVKTSFLAR